MLAVTDMLSFPKFHPKADREYIRFQFLPYLKETFSLHRRMSAVGGKAAIASQGHHVRL
jgi:hypothetical protein